ncbi:MAG: ankyrin repeat domain-containing protein [Alphaproteobacteria bacterium]|nr:MAG: ankyrin repeat domain-containing protein [Alphaproteobacteria bacterium]
MTAEPAPEEPSKELRDYLFNLILYRHSHLIPSFIEQYPGCVNWRLNSDLTPLMDAVMQDHFEIAEMLLKAGARVNDRTADNGMTAMYFAGRAPGCIDLLLQYGADINDKMSNGETALTNAVSNGNTAAALKLIDRGADIECLDWAKWTPLVSAAYHGNAAICAALLRAGADMNARGFQGRNALEVAQWGRDNNTWNEEYLRTLKVLEPAFAAKSQAELQVVLDGIEAEVEQGTDKPVAVCKPLRFKPRSFYRLFKPV